MKESGIWLFGSISAILICGLVLSGACTESSVQNGTLASGGERFVTDGAGRTVAIPTTIDRVLCSDGGTCVRYLAYLGATDTLAGVAGSERVSTTARETRAYLLATPRLSSLPVTGSIDASLDPAGHGQVRILNPQVIFFAQTGTGPVLQGSYADELQAMTGIPVIVIAAGSLENKSGRSGMFATWRLLGRILGREDRSEDLVAYINTTLLDLDNRTKDIPEYQQKTAYIGGISRTGWQNLSSTQSGYLPFSWNHIKNVADDAGVQTTGFSKEALIYADPEFIFLDAGTPDPYSVNAAFKEIKNPLFATLTAVRSNNVYGVLPYSDRGTNIETQLADAYFIGKIVYPDRFSDIDPVAKADEIYTMVVGKPVFGDINANCMNLGFKKVFLS